MPEGRDLTNLAMGNEAPRIRPQPTYRPPVQSVAPTTEAMPQRIAPTNGLRFGGNGQWRTILKTKDRNMTTFTQERPTVTTSGTLVHIHSERFDFIMSIDKIEELEIEFGEVPVVPEIEKEEVIHEGSDESVVEGIVE